MSLKKIKTNKNFLKKYKYKIKKGLAKWEIRRTMYDKCILKWYWWKVCILINYRRINKFHGK